MDSYNGYAYSITPILQLQSLCSQSNALNVSSVFLTIRKCDIRFSEMGSPCNENGEYKNYQKNNRMDAIKKQDQQEDPG